MLSRLVVTFLPTSKRLLISWLQSPSAVILEPPKIKSDTVSTVSPSICIYSLFKWWNILKFKIILLSHLDPDAGKDWGQEEKDDRGWDGWMASPTQWTWVWVNSGSWWWTGRLGVLWSMRSQRVGHDWATELNWIDSLICLRIHIWRYIHKKKSLVNKNSFQGDKLMLMNS